MKGNRGLCSAAGAALLGLILVAAAARAEVPVPPLQQRVTDLTATLTAPQRSELDARLAAIEASKGSQIAILLVPTTQPEAIEHYSMRVAEAWKLGRKGVDDGVLVLLAKEDRRARIEVGYGLEGALPDAIAKRIVSEAMTPAFKQGDFYGGLLAGVNRIGAVIDGEPLPVTKNPVAGGFNAGYIFAALAAALVIGGVLRALLGSFVGGLLNGGLMGLLLWILGTGLAFALAVGVIAFFMTLSGARGFLNGPTSLGGGGFGGGGSGGGFSGGGGGFGGGGASGSW